MKIKKENVVPIHRAREPEKITNQEFKIRAQHRLKWHDHQLNLT